MPLKSPPTNLTGFPVRRRSAATQNLFRIFWYRDPAGNRTSVWNFTTGANRFDIPAPNGTCYWSDRRYGAWVEVFRGAKIVDTADAAQRRLWSGSAPVLRLADLLAPKAYAFGVTAAISTIADYTKPQEWATELHNRGFDGVVGTCSHDPSSTALNVAVFGRAGTPRSQPGWRTAAGRIETDIVLLRELAQLGVIVAPAPHSVPISAP